MLLQKCMELQRILSIRIVTLACFGDGVISVWDARKLNQPLLIFSERHAIANGARLKPGSLYANIEFSSIRRGCLATLEKDSSYVRFWDLAEVSMHSNEGSLAGGGASDSETRGSRDSSRASRRSWAANLPWPAGGDKQQLSPMERDISPELFSQSSFAVFDTRRSESSAFISLFIWPHQYLSAKYFSRSLTSFALVPNPNISHPLTSKVMAVNKDGDLELYAIHYTPKQPIWSARGDLAIGAGVGLKVIEGYQNITLADECSSESADPTRSIFKYNDIDKVSRSTSDPTREHPIVRGRSGQPSGHLLDVEGFPALSQSVAPTGLSATRPAKTRTYSPASVRKYRRSQSRTDTIPVDEPSNIQRRRTTKLREVRKHDISRVIQEDISMVMRRRVLAGYGLSKVNLMLRMMLFDTEC